MRFLIIGLIIALSGCSLGLRPESSSPSEREDYYGDSAYGSYYSGDTGSPNAYKYYYDSAYDPWTMGNYYDNYSPPHRVERSSDSSRSSDVSKPNTDNIKPSVKDRDLSKTQPKAPGNSESSLRRERIVNREKVDAVKDSQSVSSHKKRRDDSQKDNSRASIQDNSKANNTESNSNSNDDDKDEKNRKRRRSSVK